MKRKSFISIAAILLLFFELQVDCLAQDITVDFFEPPPGLINVGSLTTMLRLTNNTAVPLDIYIYGEVYEATDGLIAWGQSGTFNLPPGIQHFVTLNDVDPYEYHFVSSNPIYETTVTITNSIPVGTYTYCAKFYNNATGLEILNTYTCSDPFEATSAFPPSLVLPSDGDTIFDLPNFSWLPAIPTPSAGGSIYYKLRIVELLPGQSKIDGMSINPAFIEIIIPNLLNYNYDLSNPLLIDGNEYAWQVQSLLSDGITPYGDNNGKSEVWSFEILGFLPLPSDNFSMVHISTIIEDIGPLGNKVSSPYDLLPFRINVKDLHAIIQECSCGDSLTRIIDTIEAPVDIRWDLIDGGGGFVVRNDTTMLNYFSGESVLYMPPKIETDSIKNVNIKITVSHAESDSLIMPKIHLVDSCLIHMTINHMFNENNIFVLTDHLIIPGTIDDLYSYQITSNIPSPTYNTILPELEGDCSIEKKWKNKTPITGYIDSIPGNLISGDLVVLNAEAFDLDSLEIIHSCSDTNYKILNDKLKFTWSATNGSFPVGNIGKDVIWQVPMDTTKSTINLIVSNGEEYPDWQLALYKEIGNKKLGVRLENLPNNWEPDARNKLVPNIKPTICYYDEALEKWTPDGSDRGKKEIILSFIEVSHEPGICMNFPVIPNSPVPIHPPDLFFDRDKNDSGWKLFKNSETNLTCPKKILIADDNPTHDKHYLTIWSKNLVNSLEAYIRIEDYGAFGKLKAEAHGCISHTITIPNDKDGNDIPDGLAQNGSGAKAYNDNDNDPVGNGYKGDGFTNYQEYRGFIRYQAPVGGIPDRKHERTDINKKDIFVANKEGLALSLDYFKNTGLNVWEIHEDDFFKKSTFIGLKIGGATEHPIEINFNRCRNEKHCPTTAAEDDWGAQHGLYLKEINFGSEYGICKANMSVDCKYAEDHGLLSIEQKDKTFVTPKWTWEVHIHAGNIKNRKNEAGGDLFTTPDEKNNAVRKTVAHEVGHGINIPHHGDFDVTAPKVYKNLFRFIPIWKTDPTTGAFITDASGNKILDHWNPVKRDNSPADYTTEGGEIYYYEGQTSGQTSCMMTYDNRKGYAGHERDRVFRDVNENGSLDTGVDEIPQYNLTYHGNNYKLPYYNAWYKYKNPHSKNKIPNKYCDKKDGDEHNAGNAAPETTSNPAGTAANPDNNARRGDCIHKIRVKSW
jgi:hypothetical protein